MRFEKMLSGGDLRSIGQSNSVAAKVKTQNDFDELFKFLFHTDRLVVMRAADAMEKITINNPHYLTGHKQAILALYNAAKDKELKWHLALLLPRLQLNGNEMGKAWNTLTKWAKDKTNSRIVRVNSIHGLWELSNQQNNLVHDFKLTLLEVEKENISSLNARIRRIKKRIT